MRRSAGKRLGIVALLGLVLGLGLWMFVRSANTGAAREAATAPDPVDPRGPAPQQLRPQEVTEPTSPPVETAAFRFPVSEKAAAPLPSPTVAERSPLADKLNRPGRSALDDARDVREIFNYFVETFDAVPVGDNAEITQTLTGANPRGLAFIPSDVEGVILDGELVDRWQTPYFFHTLSRYEVVVRSAGPDGEHWTGDDVVFPDLPPTDWEQ